jgi:hypothetical protein
MNDIKYEDVKKAYKKKDYRFCEGVFNVNIFGIRDLGGERDMFNDWVGVAYEDDLCEFQVDLYKATTLPGIHWLRNPLNKNGTLIMLEGRHPLAYKIGVHGRTSLYPYEALEQNSNMKYVRDGNKNDQYDIDLSKKLTGNFKTNIHRTSRWSAIKAIGKFSAGCQVIQDPQDFDKFMYVCHKQEKLGFGDKFSYTLFNIKDFS